MDTIKKVENAELSEIIELARKVYKKFPEEIYKVDFYTKYSFSLYHESLTDGKCATENDRELLSDRLNALKEKLENK